MSTSENLELCINQYEQQLSQVNKALNDTAEGEDRVNLLSLRSDIEELIQLTKQSLSNHEKSQETKNLDSCSTSKENSIDDEYVLFQAELKALNDSNNTENLEETNDFSSNIEDELKALEGEKCQAPFESSWEGVTYHNAMICSVYNEDGESPSLNNILVKVLFMNPVHKEMLPCPYFLDGNCKFSDEQCHFSHGFIIPFSKLKEYNEPDFSSIKVGSKVLAKQNNKLWNRSTVLKIAENNEDNYSVKIESSGVVLEVDIHDLLPLTSEELDSSDSSDDSDYEDEINNKQKEIISKSLLSVNHNEVLGGWEKHTRGMGSKIMAQMGYIIGTGLGKEADGRIDPVEATVLPAGKSLDHCMILRENAGGDKDLFSVQRKMKKQEAKLEEQRRKAYLREKMKEKHNVFNFINSKLGDKEKEPEPSTSKSYKSLKTESNTNLNIESLKIEERIKSLEAESQSLENSLNRLTKGSMHYNNIISKYNSVQEQINKLKISEKRIANEKIHRKNRAKLTIF